MVSPNLEAAGIPPKSPPPPQEPVKFVAWKGFPPRQVSPQEDLVAPLSSGLPPKRKTARKGVNK